LWLPSDTEKALAYEVADREACAHCGTRKEQWLDVDGLPMDPPLLEAIGEYCEGCARRERLNLDIQARHRDDKPEQAARAMAGISVVLAPFDPRR